MDYLPTALAIAVGAGFALLLLGLARSVPRWLLPASSPGKPSRPSPAKDYPYEAGSPVVGSPRARFSVKFYQVAILFLVFDLEGAFLYPWAVRYRELSCAGPLDGGACTAGASLLGFGEILVFMGVLVVALAYVWRKRAVGWE